MEDVSVELLKKIRSDFWNKYRSDPTVNELLTKIKNGGDYKDADKYANRLGEILSSSLEKYLIEDNLPDGKLYRNIAESTVVPMLKEASELISERTVEVQNGITSSAGFKFKSIAPKFDKERAESFVDRLTEYQSTDEEVKADNNKWLLDAAEVSCFLASEVADSIKENASLASDAGVTVYVTRETGGNCCEWCDSLAGTYVKGEEPDDFYARHRNCTCEFSTTYSKIHWH